MLAIVDKAALAQNACGAQGKMPTKDKPVKEFSAIGAEALRRAIKEQATPLYRGVASPTARRVASGPSNHEG